MTAQKPYAQKTAHGKISSKTQNAVKLILVLQHLIIADFMPTLRWNISLSTLLYVIQYFLFHRYTLCVLFTIVG